MDLYSPKQRALAWWAARADAQEYVVPRAALPSTAEAAVLREEGYIVEVAGGLAWIVARPDADTLETAFYANYWRIIRVLLDTYAPAVVERMSAVRLHSELDTPPRRLTIRQGANQSRRTIDLAPGMDPGFEVRIHEGVVDAQRAVRLRPMGVEIATESPADTLLGLPVSYLREEPETVSVWLKSLVLSKADIEAAYAARPRPVVLKRIGLVAREVGNTRLADQIDDVLRGAYNQPVGRGHTSRGPEFIVPAAAKSVRSTRLPWLDRQAVTFRRFVDQVLEEVAATEDALPRFQREVLLEHARAAKAYDAYHSTTMEGYRITPEEVSALLRGARVAGHDPEDVRARMAIAGYSAAFERVLEVLRTTDGPVRLDDHLIHDLYVDLFSPSVDAGLAEAETLRSWRNHRAYLRGYAHVPPSPEKIHRLMQQYEELVNDVTGHPIVRAVMAQLEFVTIHPYPDGNGRLSRFLLNLALVGEGLPWVTLRVEDRRRYFDTLHRAQVEDDARAFARLISDYLSNAVAGARA